MSPNETDGGAQPPSGFTFADKRKVSPDGIPITRPETEPAAEVPPGTGVAEGLAPPADGQTAQEVEAMLRAADEAAAERLSDLQRLQAEYANYRKRMDRDRAAAREQTIASVVESLLPVLDDIHLARQHG